MDHENDAVCEKIINEIDLVFQNDSDLYVKCFLLSIQLNEKILNFIAFISLVVLQMYLRNNTLSCQSK